VQIGVDAFIKICGVRGGKYREDRNELTLEMRMRPFSIDVVRHAYNSMTHCS